MTTPRTSRPSLPYPKPRNMREMQENITTLAGAHYGSLANQDHQGRQLEMYYDSTLREWFHREGKVWVPQGVQTLAQSQATMQTSISGGTAGGSAIRYTRCVKALVQYQASYTLDFTPSTYDHLVFLPGIGAIVSPDDYTLAADVLTLADERVPTAADNLGNLVFFGVAL